MNNGKLKLIKAIIFLIIISSILTFVFLKNKSQEQETYKIRKEIFGLNKTLSNEELLKKQKNLLEKTSTLELFLFEKDNPVVFIEIIEELGANNFLKTSVNKVDVIGEDLILEANLSGSFQNIINFILSLESLKKEVNIKNIRFNKVLIDKEVSWNIYLNIIGKVK